MVINQSKVSEGKLSIVVQYSQSLVFEVYCIGGGGDGGVGDVVVTW